MTVSPYDEDTSWLKPLLAPLALGLVAAGRVRPYVWPLYRQFIRQSATPEFAETAAKLLPGWLTRAAATYFRGPWFHGTRAPYSIVEQGFDPQKLGSGLGVLVGEPAGVSLTRHPEVALNAVYGPGSGVLQVFPVGRLSGVLSLMTPQGRQTLQQAVQQAMESLNVRSPLGAFLRGLGVSEPPQRPIVPLFSSFGAKHPELIHQLNRRVADLLRGQGYWAVLRPPQAEWLGELRVLDPARAVPIGLVARRPGINYLPARYLRGLTRAEDVLTDAGLLSWKELVPDYAMLYRSLWPWLVGG